MSSGYARQTWSGVILDYYLPRWSLFFDMLKKSLEKRGKYKQKTYYKKFIINIGLPFNMSTKKYPIEPCEETLKVVLEIYKRWRNFSFTNVYEHHLIETMEKSNY